MTLLFELITPQHFIGGAGEYIRKVFYTLLEHIENTRADIEVIALIDSSVGRYSYSDLSPEVLKTRNLQVVDMNGTSFKEIIVNYNIDKFFFGCGQYMAQRYDLENINIPGIIVVHDLYVEEWADSQINEIPNLPYNWFRFTYVRLCQWTSKILGCWRDPHDVMKKVMNFVQYNKLAQLVTVSEYTRSSIDYYFDYPIERVPVLYSCERINLTSNNIDDHTLSEIVSSSKRYYLMLSANRPMKNSKNVIKAFRRFVENGHKDVYLLTTGLKKQEFENHIPLGYLSDNDFVQVMRHCYALIFPSFFEGFGYPPMEAMGCGKPVLSSNVTSMPEILGNAPLYFSPIYASDIYRTLCTLDDKNYYDYVNRSKLRYAVVSERQRNDLKKLIDMIVS